MTTTSGKMGTEEAQPPFKYIDEEKEQDEEEGFSRTETSSDKESSTGLAKQETRNVNWLRAIVALVLMISAITIALSVYFYVHNSEVSSFQTSFTYDADKMFDSIGASIKSNLGAMDSFASMLVSFANSTNQTFPFVTLPTFALKASKLLTMSDAFIFMYQPILTSEQRLAWEKYSMENQWWVNETKDFQSLDHQFFYSNVTYGASNPPQLFNYTGVIPYDQNRRYMPQWQNYPVVDPAFNWDFLTGGYNETYGVSIDNGRAIFSPPYCVPDPNDPAQVQECQVWADLFGLYLPPDEPSNEPFSDFMYPVMAAMDTKDNLDANFRDSQHTVLATFDSCLYWRQFIKNVLPDSSQGVIVVFENPCSASFTYEVSGRDAAYVGRGDHHDPKYDGLGISQKLNDTVDLSRYTGVSLDSEFCPFSVNIYPSDQYRSQYVTTDSEIFAVCAVFIFVFVSVVFFVYDVYVERRQKVVLNTANTTNAIVSSLFPSAVREQLLLQNAQTNSDTTKSTDQLSRALYFGQDTVSAKSLASLYPETTVLFADLAGFTAWSSARNPSQVFMLLEVLYGEFDKIAKRRKVFKVETIGDCYVAVSGLPDPNKHHALTMARFAFDCLTKMYEVTNQLTSTLGLETADLRIRIGLNSGPTTAGVLRGEKARFQLFGDTVNTASRMESMGKPGRIQVSQKTADLLMESGKGEWLTERSDIVEVKGKGAMKTYWLTKRDMNSSTAMSQSASSSKEDTVDLSEKGNRLVEWNFVIFENLLLQVIASHVNKGSSLVQESTCQRLFNPENNPLDEIGETVEVTQAKISHSDATQHTEQMILPKLVESQLLEFLKTISHMYKRNPFHNFEHASHVVMSTTKLMDRIQEQEEVSRSNTFNRMGNEEEYLYLDPLTRLGVVFAALIHDVDHQGLSNTQLIEQGCPIASLYGQKSIAEQNSIDVAWKLLMQPDFQQLRCCMFANQEDLKRFRQVVVNSVLATDIFDKTLKEFREQRWNQVFSGTSVSQDVSTNALELSNVTNRNRKNAIVIEHLIQASDVVHTMQHWHVYQTWNYRLFKEMYFAYKCGYSNKNPVESWYNGELWFFDNYIIPLAKKLRVCGVFGVSCDEFLSYAIDNRYEWQHKGQDIVKEWERKAQTLWEQSVSPEP